MNKNHLYVHILLDRSGSMEECRDTAIGAINEYVHSLRVDENLSARLSITLFDSGGIDALFDRVPLEAVPAMTRETFVPRGMTPLNDAIGTTVARIDETVLLKEETVAFVILTDGLENASREYSKDAVKALIESRQRDKKWLVLYLGANQDAFAEGAARGLSAGSTLPFDTECMPAAMKAVARASRAFAAAPSAEPAFTASERANARR
jgi:uncharacterized protein YegL